MSSRREKDALFEAIALMGKAFASPRRLELLDLLAQAPRTVDELARASGQSTANALWVLQPSRYEAQAVWSFSSWRRYMQVSVRSSSSA